MVITKKRRPRIEYKNGWLYVNGKEASWGLRPNEKCNLYEIAVVCDVYIFDMPSAFFDSTEKYNELKTIEDRMSYTCQKTVEYIKAAKYIGHKII